ncbi:MAG TPA: hypothetical protein VLD16_03125 [Gaiellaceae bacterium]|nr:hypothetical protein [Gaiellaceae bacterium]
MRKMTLLAGLALALGAFLPGSARPAIGGSDLPLKGAASGYFTLNLLTGQSHVVGTSGQLTHLGLWTSVQDEQLIPTGVPNTFNLVTGGTTTAANGDQLFFTGTGSGTAVIGSHGSFVINYVSSAGTGRFASASATFTAVVESSFVSLSGAIETGVWDATFDGQLRLSLRPAPGGPARRPACSGPSCS